MQYKKTYLAILLMPFIAIATKAQEDRLKVIATAAPGSFPVATNTGACSFYFDTADARVVAIAAKAFINDINSITGKAIIPHTDNKLTGNYTIVAGTIGHSAVIDRLISTKKLDVSDISGQWERFSISVIDNPPGSKLLVIAGSDRRGTAFGIFHLSRLMGVSPFYWWADIAPAKKDAIYVSGNYVSSSPSVKYRGIFINDEDWGLQPWAAQNLDKDVKDIGPNTYAKVFELLLRLKANYIWPAMHPCTKAFYYYPNNPKVADDYAIVVGGSHCEPMLRNNVFEWTEHYEKEYGQKPGEWRYDLNKTQIYNYWNDRVKQAVGFESMYTVGMRGIHDGSMPGPKDPDAKLKLLSDVIVDQRSILANNFHKEPTTIPQVFIPYKEVLSLYRRGLQLPDDVTIIWPDDNHGYIRQLPNEKEQKRSGGHGVYYHLSYWGSPHDYLWLSSISPSLIGFEMTRAYRYGADRLWVFNVGDIKPAELEMQFALDMAWDINEGSAANAYQYTKKWAAETFGVSLANEIAAIKNDYYVLAQSGKPEHLGLVHFDSTTWRNRLLHYQALAGKVMYVEKRIPKHLTDAYYELINYPVLGAWFMNQKISNARNSFNPGNKLSNASEILSQKAFENIRQITGYYNDSIAGGKWKGIMDWQPRKLPVFGMPLLLSKVDQNKADSLRAVYSRPRKPLLIINAADFISKHETPVHGVTIIEGLGINGRGLTRYPKNNQPETDSAGVYCDYSMDLPAGDYKVIVKCLPGFDADVRGQLRYAIAYNGNIPMICNLHVEAESNKWKENVLRGYMSGETPLRITTGGRQSLRIWLRDNHLVLNTIEIIKE